MHSWAKMIIAATIITVTIIAGTMIYFQYFTRRRLVISTTTSLDDTGLLDEISKAYEATHNVDLSFIPVGTGIAIQHAQNGDVDLTLVHSPSNEKTLLEGGDGVCRKIIAYNFFTIVGDRSDPARIQGLNATEALKTLARYGENQTSRLWVTRGDNSGTHQKEQSLWKSAGLNYTTISAQPWYVNASNKMGDTLIMTQQFSAYTLSDIGTYLKYKQDGRITLLAFMTEEKALLNVYSVIAVNQTKHPSVNFGDAIDFIKYLISDDCQQLIENYGKDNYTQSLFHGAIQPLKQNSTSQIVQWISDYAFFNGTECPQEYRDGHPELYD
ncbi:substrate-binding domain-containing protein [Candidatus Bathyarchaeota archaeon]|nr:substrate-binding domain-containing protein [Candidatus Bathyarchaeota archaeon]